MMETIVVLKLPTQWRTKTRWYSDWPDFLKPVFRPFWPDTISSKELVNAMNAALTLPGQTNAWSMSIKNRIDMLTTGIRPPVGVKIFGADLAEIEKVGQHLEGILQKVPGTRSVFGERVAALFRGLRPQPRADGPLPSDDRRSAGSDHDRDRRRERVDVCRRTQRYPINIRSARDAR